MCGSIPAARVRGPDLDQTAGPRPAQAVRRPATLALGFALGGFFDGIVLHQVLQWHHLLSAVDAPGLAEWFRQAGFDDCTYELLLGGVAALHVATVGARGEA